MTYDEQISRLQVALLHLHLALEIVEPIYNAYVSYGSAGGPGDVNAPSVENALADVEEAERTFTSVIDTLRNDRKYDLEHDTPES
jgi:hypothetical protein